MRKNILFLLLSAAVLFSCKDFKEEWQPVFAFNYENENAFVPFDESQMPVGAQVISISEFRTKYAGKGVIKDFSNIYVKGQVVSSDETANVYKLLYIDDGTAGLEIHIGRGYQYNEYHPGQWLYVLLDGMASDLTEYGMAQVGYGTKDDYGYFYLDTQALINGHLYKGKIGDERPDAILLPEDFGDDPGKYMGRYVSIPAMFYDNAIYMTMGDYGAKFKDGTSCYVRFDATDNTNFGVTTWAMSQEMFNKCMYGDAAGPSDTKNTEAHDCFFNAAGTPKVKAAHWDYYYSNNQYAHSMGQFFLYGTNQICVYTRGYCDFADKTIPGVDGSAVSMKGILTGSNSSYSRWRLRVMSLDDVSD